MHWIEEQASVLGMRAATKHDRGTIRVTVEIVNAGNLPLEDIRLKLHYDGGEFRLVGKAKQWMNHMLPGDVVEHVYTLTPRGIVQGSHLLLRASAAAGAIELEEELDLGWHSLMPSRHRPYDRRAARARAME